METATTATTATATTATTATNKLAKPIRILDAISLISSMINSGFLDTLELNIDQESIATTPKEEIIAAVQGDYDPETHDYYEFYDLVTELLDRIPSIQSSVIEAFTDWYYPLDYECGPPGSGCDSWVVYRDSRIVESVGYFMDNSDCKDDIDDELRARGLGHMIPDDEE